MAHRKWKEFKQQKSMLPGSAVPGCCLVSFHFLWATLSMGTVQNEYHICVKLCIRNWEVEEEVCRRRLSKKRLRDDASDRRPDGR